MFANEILEAINSEDLLIEFQVDNIKRVPLRHEFFSLADSLEISSVVRSCKIPCIFDVRKIQLREIEGALPVRADSETVWDRRS